MFYDDFEKILTKLHNEYPDAELYVNVSSGTPAMKSCLMVLNNVLLFPIHVIQVAGPPNLMDTVHGKRESVPKGELYNVDFEWDNNLDNLQDAQNRTTLLLTEQQSFRILRKQMETLIDHDEYYAAFLLANGEARSFLSDNTRKSLEAAAERMSLNLYHAVTILNEVGYSEEPYLKTQYKNDLFRACEMIRTMNIDVKRNDLGSYLRKLTPVLCTLADEFLKSNGVDLEKVIIRRNKGEDWIDIDRFRQLWPEIYMKDEDYFSRFPHYGFASNTLISIIELVDGADFKGVENLKKLRKIEENARHPVAHELVKITRKRFKELADCEPEMMLSLMKETVGIIQPRLVPPSYWRGYDKMKVFLKAQLHERKGEK